MIRFLQPCYNQVRENFLENCPGYDEDDSLVVAEPEKHITYRPLAERINESFPSIQSILELGCGGGNLAKHFREINPIQYITVDINEKALKNGIINTDFHYLAFTDRPFLIFDDDKIKEFDLILSFEHFEHIPEERFSQLLLNIKNHSHNETIIFATSSRIYRECHLINWGKQEYSKILDENGFTLLDWQILSPEVIPCNFKYWETEELVFKIK